MSETLKLVQEIYGTQESVSRAVQISIREANLSERRKGFWFTISSLFSGA